MPFYEYQCGECGHRLEALQKISDAPLVYCPECSEATLKKLVSAAAFRLKGTGWYETDFKNNGKQKEQDKKESSATGSAGDGKTGEKSGDGKSNQSKNTDSSKSTGDSSASASAA